MSQGEGMATALFAMVIGGAIAVGIAIDVTAPLCDAAKIKSMAPDKIEFGCFEFWLNRYQTLLAGIAALLAASASVFYLRKQIGQAEQHRQDQLLRDRAAARTVLPLALSTICEYANRSVQSLNERYAGGSAELPPIPMDALDQLVATVRTLEIQHVEPFAKIAQEIQVHNARVSDRRENRRINEANFQEYLLDAAEIYARASSLFEFARLETDDLPSVLFADQMKSALWSTGAEYDREGPLHQAIDRRGRRYPRRSV
jgi:Tfp pilus assembly protein PilN